VRSFHGVNLISITIQKFYSGARMNKKLGSLLSIVTLTLTLVASFSVAMVSAVPGGVIREKTFTTYYEGDPIGTPSTDSYDVFAYSGIHWSATTTNIAYYVKTKGAPAGAVEAVKAAFEEWDGEIGDSLFSDDVGTVTKGAGNKFDGKNIISWARLGRGIIAQTTVWFYSETKEIVEFGIVFSTAYKWGIDADGEGTTYTLTKMFDIQNIATHEAGHTLMLDDLYMPETSALTMYGYGDYGETYARSLGAGDISGINYIYG